MRQIAQVYTWTQSGTTYLVKLFTSGGAVVRITCPQVGSDHFWQQSHAEGVALIDKARREGYTPRLI